MIELFNMPHRPREKQPLEIAEVIALSPFTIKVDGVTYSTHDIQIYVPRRYLIEQKDDISAPHEAEKAYIDKYDLDIEPDPERKPLSFNIGDRVLITDRGNQIVVIMALFELPIGSGV